MRLPFLLAATALTVAGLGVATDSRAVTCYVVMDRTENVMYRDVYPPVDMSDSGRAEREAMRRRGEILLFMESEICPRLEFFTGTAGDVALKLDQTSATPTDVPRDAVKPAAPAEAAPRAPRAPRKPAPKG